VHGLHSEFVCVHGLLYLPETHGSMEHARQKSWDLYVPEAHEKSHPVVNVYGPNISGHASHFTFSGLHCVWYVPGLHRGFPQGLHLGPSLKNPELQVKLQWPSVQLKLFATGAHASHCVSPPLHSFGNVPAVQFLCEHGTHCGPKYPGAQVKSHPLV